MLFVTGLLTLLALASAGGDHVKGGGHIKGNPLASASKTVQQQVSQEEVAASPYNFNIKTGAAYGTKITREETGDSEGRVKGSYTIDGPRGTSRVVQYQADDSGFHASIKTSEPNIKTHSPSNVQIEAVPKKGVGPIAQSTQQHELLEKTHRATELHHAAVVPVVQDPIVISDGDLSGTRTKGIKTVVPSGSLSEKIRFVSKLREPTARPVVDQQKFVKTVESLTVKGSSPAQIKGASGTKSIVITQQDENPLHYSPVTGGAADTLPENVLGERIIALNRGLIQKQGEAGFSRTFGGVIRTDNNLESISLTSSDVEDLSKQIGYSSAGQPLAAPELKKLDTVKPTVVRTSSQRVSGYTRTRVIPGPTRVSGDAISTSQEENIRVVLGNDAGSVGVVRPSGQAVFSPKPKAPVLVRPQAQFGDGIVAINRELIQKQGEAGFSQTFGGVIRMDSNLEGVSITSSELEDLSKRIGYGTRGQPLASPVPRKPDQVKPTVVRTSSQRVSDSTRTRVIPGPARVSGAAISTTQGENIPFVLGNDAGSAGVVRSRGQAVPALKPKVPTPVQPQAQLGDGIIAINRGLIKKQSEAGFSQTFGGVIRTDGNLEGLSITSSELEDLSKSVGYGSAGQPQAEPELKKPDPVKPTIVRTSPQRVIDSSRRRIIPGPFSDLGAAISTTQGENIRFVLGNDAGSAGVSGQAVSSIKPKVPVIVQPQAQFGDGIIAINRELIQKQGEAGFSQTFGGVIRTDGNLQGVSISSSELEDLSKRIRYGTRGQPLATPALRKPDQVKPVVRTSAQRITDSTRTRVIPGAVRVSGAAISSTQGENIRFVLGNDAGSVGVVGPSGQAVFSPKPKAPVLVRPQAQFGDGIVAINRELIQKQGEAGFSQTFGGVIRTDGNLQGVSITASELEDLSKRIRYGTRGQPLATPVLRKPDQVKPVVRTSAQQVTGSTRTRVIPGAVRISGAAISSTQGENTRFVLGNDAGSVGVVGPSGQAVFSPKPKAPVLVRPQAQFGDGIVAINRELIQKQGEAGFSQTFGGVIRTDGNLQGVSITASELEDLSKHIRYGTRGQALASPIPKKPYQVKPSAVRTSSQRVTDSTRTRVIPGPARVSGAAIPTTQGENIPFVLGNDAASAGVVRSRGQAAPVLKSEVPTLVQPQVQLEDGIKAINRGLIKKQSEAGFSQTFGGVIRTDGNLDGLSITSSELEDLSKRIGYGSSGQPQAVPELKKPDQVKPIVVRTSSQRVTGSTRTSVIPSPAVISTNQGENIKFVLGNDAGSVGVRPGSHTVSSGKPKVPAPVQTQAQLGDGIIAINRELIQKQGESGFSQTFGGVIRTDGNLEGISVTSSELEDLSKRLGYGTRGQPLASPVLRKPDQVKPTVVRTSSQRVTGSTRTRVIPGPARVSGAAISTTQGENIRVVLGNDAGSVGTVRSRGQGVPAIKPITNSIQPNRQLNDGIIALNRGLIQKQGVAGLSETFGGVIRTDGNLAGVSISSEEVGDLSRRIGYDVNKVEVRAPLRKPDRVVNQNAVGQQVRVTGNPFILGTGPESPQILSAKDLNDEIIQLNRGLIDKQGAEGVLQTFRGIAKSDSDLDGIAVSLEDLKELSRNVGAGVSRTSSGTSESGGSGSGQDISGAAVRSASGRQPSLNRGPGSRGPETSAIRQRTGPIAYSGASAPVGGLRSSVGASGVQQKINQDRIESQVIQEKFESSFPTASSVKEIQPNQQSIIPDFIVIDSPASQPAQKVVDEDGRGQLQLKLDDIVEQSSPPRSGQKVLNSPLVQSQVVVEDFNAKYLQEKLPVEIPGYVPAPSFMSPFNYRVPGLRSIQIPTVQEQQRLEQVFV